ncbi:MAG: CHAT domain-containing protein [Candidatus Rokubacteria bacterium]|nr:CHAT domain-containing protein [Candidatus Rokubacteria bacterium]
MHHGIRERWLLTGLIVLLAGCVTVPAEPPPERATADAEFPPSGTRWITRSVDQTGRTWITTWNVLEEGSYQGEPAYRVSDQLSTLVYDKATRSWMATLQWDEERFAASPHDGAFSWPLRVGKWWVATYAYHDRQRGRSFPRVEVTWRVEAYEDVTVPAGTFKAFRLQGRAPAVNFTRWYAPDLRLVAKEIAERNLRHHLGAGKVVTELIQRAPPGGEKWYGFSHEAVNDAIRRGEGREAVAFSERQAGELEKGGLQLEAAQAHIAAMWGARTLGLYQKGIRAGLRALELLKREPPSDDVNNRIVNIHFTLGTIYRLAGDLQEGRRHHQEGTELSRSFTNARSRLFWSANFARGLADLAVAEGDFATAIRQGGESVQLLEKYLAALHSDSPFDQFRRSGRQNLAWSLVLVGNAHRRQGNLAAAESAFSQALALARELRADELEANAVVPLGWIALARRDWAAALRHFEASKAVGTRLNQVPLLMWSHTGIGWSHFRERRYDEALAAFRRALDLVEDIRGELQDPGLRSGFLEDKQGMYHGAVWSAILLDKADEAFSLAERGRSRAFLDLLGTQTVLSKGKTRALVEEEVRLRARLSEAKALALDATGAGDRAAAQKQVDAAERAYRAFLERVRLESREQASLMTVEPVTLQEVQRLLPEDTTLVEYLVTERESVAWVVDRSRVEVVRLPVRRADLATEVREFRQSIEDRTLIQQVEARAQALHERLFARVRPHIRTERVLLVPHDVLHYLPFGALRDRSGRWLVEDFTLTTLPSASVLKYLQGKGQAAGNTVLAVGNPDLGPALNLRYAEREARSVGDRFPGARVLLRQDATKLKVKALSGEADLIHLATHGELNEQDPLGSALLLVPEGADGGRLEVRELFGLDLKARLVVLSACETGLGKLSQGDELVGLQRAFLYAGTPAVVTTLWKVDDRASFFLMREFYDQLKTRGPAEALRRAQSATMGEFPHPFFWAAFTVTGAPE